MSKKFVDPWNIENMKRQYMAEQKNADQKRREQESREQYKREQKVFSNKQLMGDEKARLGLSFMYDQPVHCLKCKKWGHVNTDKICPLYGKSRLMEDAADPVSQLNSTQNIPTTNELIKDLHDKGFAMKRNIAEHMMTHGDTNDNELEVIKQSPKKNKCSLIKRLKYLERSNQRISVEPLTQLEQQIQPNDVTPSNVEFVSKCSWYI
ncbi:unnamed protein product [Adineta steineri]|uniref:CBF1-interacting co-repressor CIR N-terminal domain-containing protein n=2 Tax=Adineta steineri TaxID=433720 RepID=A0A814HZC1_9BILA|nr:unnamed protein product [Adineta steineri]CAF1066894.1 unnamed protein product [Adineta steineri]